MKALVTGGNGFLSGHIIRELLQKQYQVRAMIRTGASVPALEGLDIDIVEGQITREQDLVKAVQGCDLVIHVAADTSQKHRSPRDYYPVNVEATEKLIGVMNSSGCKKMIYISTANTMGYGSRENPGEESRPMSGLFRKSGYAQSKYYAEESVLQAVRNGSIEAVIVNPGFMIGPMDYNPHSGRIFGMIKNKRLAFYPPGGKPFVDVRDVANGVMKAIEKGKNGERYLLTGTNLSYREFFELVLQESGKKTKLIPVPKGVLIAAGLAGSVLKQIGFRTELNTANARILCICNYYSSKKASDDLGFSARNIRETIHDYLNWNQHPTL
jgi:dihydroflavonol-4-reductase